MRKKHPEHVNLERWLVSYADFITLLFAFFVIMYAISQADIAKFKKVSASLKAAFSASGPAGMVELEGTSGGATISPFENTEMPGGRVQNLPAGRTNTAGEPDPALQEIREALEETISLETGVSEMTDQLQMQYDSRGLVVRLSVKNFFDPGESDVRSDLRPMLDRIGRVLTKTKRLVRIEGHTDPSETRYLHDHASEWELSSARAAWIAKYWMTRFQIDPKRIGVAGYAHFRPVAKSDTEWGRSANRRVEFIVLNNQYEVP